VAVGDRVLYVVDRQWAGGLRTYQIITDILTTTVPVFTAASNYPWAQLSTLSVYDQSAYLGLSSEGKLLIYDLANPIQPSEMGGGPVPANPYATAVYDQPLQGKRYVCLAAGGNGLRIIDVTDPYYLMEVGSVPFLDARSVTVAGDHAFVAAGAQGLQVVDLSDPGNAQVTGAYTATTDTWQVAVVGDIAYVAAGVNGLKILDVSDVANIVQLGEYWTIPVVNVSVLGQVAFLAKGEDGFAVVDVSLPSDPVYLDSRMMPGYVSRVAIGNGLAYIAAGDAGLYIYRINFFPAYRLSGQVLDSSSNPLHGVHITQPGSGYATRTDLTGHYFFDSVPGGENYLLPVDSWSVFTPSEWVITPVTFTTGLDFVGEAVLYTVTGRVTDDFGQPLAGLTVMNGAGAAATVDASGYYTLSLEAGEYFLWVDSTQMSFWPEERYIRVPLNREGQDFTVAAPLRQVGQIYGGASYALAKRDPYVYLGMGAGLAVVNISDSTHPFLVSKDTPFPSSPVNMAITGTTGYVAFDTSQIALLDLSNPASPGYPSDFYMPNTVSDLALAGEYVYTIGQNGFGVARRLGDNYLTHVAWLDLIGGPAIAVYGDYIYYAAGCDGLGVVHVSDPAHPSVLPGSTLMDGCVQDIALEGGYAFVGVAGDGAGLHILSLSDPSSPSETNFLQLSATSYHLDASGSFLYLQMPGLGFQVYDIGNPGEPLYQGSLDTLCYGLVAQGSLAYLTMAETGLWIVDCSTPVTPTVVGEFTDTFVKNAYDVAVTDQVAVAADGYLGGISLVSVSYPAHPAQTARLMLEPQQGTWSVATQGSYTFMSSDVNAFQVVDISDPAAPEIISTLPGPIAWDIALSPGRAYLGDSTGLRVVDITQPISLTVLGQYTQTAGIMAVEVVSDTLVFVLEAEGLLSVLDASNPADIQVMGTYLPSQSISRFAVQDGIVYLMYSTGLEVVDMSTPGAPQYLGSLDTFSYLSDVAVIGHWAYVAEQYGIKAINVADPAHMAFAGFIPGPYGFRLYHEGRYLYEAAGASGLLIYDLGALSIHSVDPSAGVNNQAQPVNIWGESFQSGAQAFLGEVALPDAAVISPTLITATIPANLNIGTYSVRVLNPDGAEATRRNAYTVLSNTPPQIVSVEPAKGLDSGPNLLSIQGSNFSPLAVVELHRGATVIPLEGVLFIGSTHLRAVVPPGLDPGVYDLFVLNPDGFTGSLSAAYTVFDASGFDDLYAFETDLWLNPPSLYHGQPVSVGLTVRRLGGLSTLSDVRVDFYLGDPLAGVLLDSRYVTLEPGQEAATQPVSLTLDAPGMYRIVAVIDPGGQVTETLEDNNTLSRMLWVPPAGGDMTPPVIESLSIQSGLPLVSDPQVALDVTALDDSGSAAYLLYLEYEYDSAMADWIVTQTSGWLEYNLAHQGYPWQLNPSPGVHYLQAWAADAAGNISPYPALAWINLLPADPHITQGQVYLFRLALKAGDILNVSLTSLAGDADLYIWDPDGNLVGSSISELPLDEVWFTAAQDGVYQIEIEGYTSADFDLLADLNGIPLIVQMGAADFDPAQVRKSGRISPHTAPTDQPGDDVGVPAAPGRAPSTVIYLPLVNRQTP